MAISLDLDSQSLILLDNGGGDVGIGDSGGGGLNVGTGDVSGGGTSNTTAAAAEQIEEFIAEGGGSLPIVYGEHLIAGILVLHKFTLGTPNTSIIIVALGDGQGNGGQHGEWEGAVAVYYAGEALSVSPDGSTAGYRFANGFISTGVASGPQQVDAFHSTGLAYSGTAIIAVKLPDATANAEDRPDKLRGRYKGRRIFDYDATGRRLGAAAYSTDPARIALDRLLAYYEHKFPNDLTLAQRLMEEKVDWESWKIWSNYNVSTISWDPGTGAGNIARFEGNIVFTGDIILADAFDQICAAAGAWWQDDGEQIIFLPPTDREPVHHFNESNILSAPIIRPTDLRERPNYFIAEFRDFDDPYLGTVSVEVRRDALIKQVGEIKSVRVFPAMKQSQAQRLLERQARLEADNPTTCTITADETSIHLLPGDFVTVSHPVPGWTYQRCLVLSVSISSAEDGADTCEFILQAINDSLYSDFAHTARQEALTP